MGLLLWFLLLYAAALLLLLPNLPLSLDEILTLVGSVKPNTAELLDYVETVAGGTPLAFLAPRWSMQLFGESVFAARLPSALASIAACPAVYLLARRAQVRPPILAVAVFALWPLQLRYALEARPYAVALALSVWTTDLFLAQIERPTKTRGALYVLLTVLSALAQPYALFVPLAHLLSQPKSWRVPVSGVGLSGIALVPWYLRYREFWSRVTGDQQLPGLDTRSPLVFLHEISGSGYLGTALIAVGVYFGIKRISEGRRFWSLCAGVPLLAVFLADYALHYFFAVRQMIFVLPAAAVLFARSGYGLLIAAFLGASVYTNADWFRKPHEDWGAAADVIQREVEAGACVRFLGDSTPVYEYFYPSLAQHRCNAPSDYVVVGTSSYVPATTPTGVEDLPSVKHDFNGPAVIIGKR